MRLKPIIIMHWRAYEQRLKNSDPQQKERYMFAFKHGYFHVREMPSRAYVVEYITKGAHFLGTKWEASIPLTEEEKSLCSTQP